MSRSIRLPETLSASTAELVAIKTVLEDIPTLITQCNVTKMMVLTDSMTALTALDTGNSLVHQNLSTSLRNNE